MTDTQKTLDCQNCDYIHVFDKIYPCKDCEGRLKFIAKNYQVAPTSPNSRDCEHGRQRGKCSDCDLRDCEVERDRLLAIVKNEARLSTPFNTLKMEDYYKIERKKWILASSQYSTVKSAPLPDCDICHTPQTELGAVMWSPPDKNKKCDKTHICVKCYPKILEPRDESHC